MMWPGLLLALLAWSPVGAQITWTPIYVDGSSLIDLWTQSDTGCPCPWDSSRKDCACCVKEGACHCGRDNPGRCAQCGLETHCTNMCNMTIDARTLKNKSGRTSGQIKSPALEGPVQCSYRLKPVPGQRVEIQLYRLLATGHHNGTSCIGGALRMDTTELCAINERYAPPVVLFSDHGDTNLIFEVTERTARSQFMAYYSFTSLSNSQGVGFQPKGGTRIPSTECDWLYRDITCRGPEPCVAASPGYPGLYPPHMKCKYVIAISSVHTKVRINFTAILFPENHCSTDYLAVHQGFSSTDPLLAKVCEQKSKVLEFSGPNLLLVFRSGNHIPPYRYNGFMAVIEFLDRPPTTTAPAALSSNASYPPHLGFMPPQSTGEFGGRASKCEMTIWADGSKRSGHFDTRSLGWHPECRITFRGKHTDVVHISIFNYELRAPSCQSVIEIVDGEWTNMPSSNYNLEKQLMKLCSPIERLARDESGKFVDHRTMVSRGPTMTLVLRRPSHSSHSNKNPDNEFLDGAYSFHDEQVAGTLQPGGLCEAQYYGLSSAPAGLLGNPVSEPLLWNVEGPLQCRHHFVPAANQSVTITIKSLGKVTSDRHCVTECGDGGCRCTITHNTLDQFDHLLLLTETGLPAACLCGNFRPEWLPVALRSWSSVQLVYHVGHYTWTSQGFSFSASYQFNDDALCGHHTVTTHSGEIYSRNLTNSGTINNFYHQHCTWILDSNVERQLIIDISTDQSRPCGAWNITIHEYSATAEDEHHTGTLLKTFCPRDTKKQFILPWRLNTVVVRVLAMTRKAPVYHVKWKSKAAVGGPAPAAAAFADPQKKPLGISTLILNAIIIIAIRIVTVS